MKFGKNLRPCVPNFSGPYREFILNSILRQSVVSNNSRTTGTVLLNNGSFSFFRSYLTCYYTSR